jgi:REP element-mobilizing transposase RayT
LRSRTMARLGRYFLPDQPLHAIQRGNNREAIFFAEDDYACSAIGLPLQPLNTAVPFTPMC